MFGATSSNDASRIQLSSPASPTLIPLWARRSNISVATRRVFWIALGVITALILVALFHTQGATQVITRHLECVSTASATSPTTAYSELNYVNDDATTRPVMIASQQAVDTFADYVGRDECGVSSLDIFRPSTIQPVCDSRSSVLTAMASGGRAGMDAPYMPRDCDMRWYTAEDACEVVSRFDQVMIVGDSLTRHMLFGLYLILRGDLLFGGLREWEIENMKDDVNVERCRCSGSFGGYCSPLLIWDSDWLPGNNTKTWRCGKNGQNQPRITFHDLKVYPMEQERMDRVTPFFPLEKPKKPLALVLGQGMWNKINESATRGFVQQLEDEIVSKVPWLEATEPLPEDMPKYWDVDRSTKNIPFRDLRRLYVSPSAGGWRKVGQFLGAQSTNSIARFELAMKPFIEGKGWEFLGLWNMSVQASSHDGTHMGIQPNLLKAQMLLNWLDKLADDEPITGNDDNVLNY